MKSPNSLLDLIFLFLRLGCTAFGGPAVHIAMMREEVVNRRHWLDDGEFLDMLAVTNLIPGPNSTEMAIHIGMRRAGWPGFWAAICFIAPAVIIVTAIAAFYVQYGKLPVVTGLLAGLKPVLIAIVLQALIGLRTALKTRILVLIFILVCLGSFYKVDQILLLLIAGTLVSLNCCLTQRSLGLPAAAKLTAGASCFAALYLGLTKALSPASGTMEFSLCALFFYFAKIGSILYGSGYVLLAFLRSDLVDHYGWLTTAQLLDATAVGQFTPGPVFTTATFIGYLLAGLPGALLATLGIFAPAFIFVGLAAPLVKWMRASASCAAFLDGINSGALALMAMVLLELGQTALTSWLWVAVCAVAMICLMLRVNSTWLLLGGGILGMLIGAK